MSLSVPIPDGVYQIFNVAFPNQDVDLVYPGGVDDYIGGWQNNSDSQRMQVTIYNLGVETYASTQLPSYPFPGSPVTGNPSSTVIWTVGISPSLGGSEQYAISLFDTPYIWTLRDGSNGAPITLELSTSLPQPNQLWTFVQLE